MEVQRIKYERTGGFAGIRFHADFKPGELPDEQARQLLDLLDDLDFDELPEQIKGDPSISDQFMYQVTVQTSKWEHTVTSGDASAPEKMQELFKLLDKIARRKKQ